MDKVAIEMLELKVKDLQDIADKHAKCINAITRHLKIQLMLSEFGVKEEKNG